MESNGNWGITFTIKVDDYKTFQYIDAKHNNHEYLGAISPEEWLRFPELIELNFSDFFKMFMKYKDGISKED
jgi:hypothetical protein